MVTPRTEEAFEVDHHELLDIAREGSFARFQRRYAIWEQIVDQDGAEQSAEDIEAASEFHLSQSIGGVRFGNLTLDPISGDIVDGTLQHIYRELFDADWAEATERLGREPSVDELRRSPKKRRADALVEMAIRARTAPADGRRPAPLFIIVVGYETFAGRTIELYNKTVVTPGSAARWLDGADVERIVFDGPSQVDHIHEASKGGPTTQDNGRMACDFHNKWRNNHPDEPEPPA